MANYPRRRGGIHDLYDELPFQNAANNFGNVIDGLGDLANREFDRAEQNPEEASARQWRLHSVRTALSQCMATMATASRVVLGHLTNIGESLYAFDIGHAEGVARAMEEIIEERRPRSPQRRANDGDGRPHRNSQGRAAEADIHDAESITRNNSYERQRPAREPQNDGVPLEGEGLQRARQRSHGRAQKITINMYFDGRPE